MQQRDQLADLKGALSATEDADYVEKLTEKLTEERSRFRKTHSKLESELHRLEAEAVKHRRQEQTLKGMSTLMQFAVLH